MNAFHYRSPADLINVSELPDWCDEDLSQMLAEQLDLSPAEFARQSMGASEFREKAEQTCPRTLAELFFSSRPSLYWLRRVKDAAKVSTEHPRQPLPNELALVLYTTAIAVAELRLNEKISHLEDKRRITALKLCSGTRWVDDRIRQICHAALDASHDA